MRGLTDEEKALAWDSAWHPSFTGTAIVNKDFVFLDVNPQFCEIVGATPAELIGERFQDITPNPVKKLDTENAKLVMQGVIDSYLLPKTYEFQDGRRVNIILLVTGVYGEDEEFLFFVSRIMRDEKQKPSKLVSDAHFQGQIEWLDFIKRYYKFFLATGTAIGGIIWTLIQFYMEGK